MSFNKQASLLLILALVSPISMKYDEVDDRDLTGCMVSMNSYVFDYKDLSRNQ